MARHDDPDFRAPSVHEGRAIAGQRIGPARIVKRDVTKYAPKPIGPFQVWIHVQHGTPHILKTYKMSAPAVRVATIERRRADTVSVEVRAKNGTIYSGIGPAHKY